ncbi:ABC1 kinase family protein [Alicyclobacillus contaminans]|uniref:ABC1 kinase family protein n=1 Tax=Alicyclobacillus contaminans TaxID=392016 RepID=UPI00040BF996|nr:AarF/ABC1/UbiB kinase family protein [Alicyclobacillus contaminans]
MNGSIWIGKRTRHIARYREIANILIRNGFGWFVDEIGLGHLLTLPRRWFNTHPRDVVSPAERIRRVVEQLGPTFVKMGQIASLRSDLLPPDWIRELSRLQDEVPPMPMATVRRIVEAELGDPFDAVFKQFSEVPVGSASIGQVHRAVLPTGETVAVKVQRPEMQSQIETDFDILMDLIHLAEKHFDWVRHYQLDEVAAEFRHSLLNEMDYTVEARNATRIRGMFENDATVYIPKVYWDFTTSKVLTMEYVEGVKLSNPAALEAAGYQPKLLAHRATKAVLTQMLMHGFFHADPHPGNLAALPGNTVLFLDFGMVGRLTPDMKDRFADLIIGLMRRNTDAVLRAIHRMGVVPHDVDPAKLRRDVDELRDKYYDVALSEVSLSKIVGDIFGVAYRHRIQIPSNLSMVGKTLLTIEGVAESLDPTFRIMDVAEPFGRMLLKDKFSFGSLSRQAYTSLLDLSEFLSEFPRQVRSLMEELRHGQVKLQWELSESKTWIRRLDRITNRISLSIVLLAWSIFLAGLMIASALTKKQSVIWNAPLAEGGLVVGLLIMVFLLWSILRSGRK